jgi:2-oxoisovalerate dehydrogenase E1 component alpha subunit
MVQLVDRLGARTSEADGGEHAARVAHLGAEELRERYRAMALLRRFDVEATALQRQGELALWASCSGQEAAQVGAAAALAAQDHVFPSYREHGLAIARGIDPVDLLQLYRGTANGGWDPASTGVHIYTLVIGAQTLHATGYAMGVQRDGAVGTGEPGRDTAVLACFGDGATAQGEVSEALNWAAVFNAPVVFFCQNNQWAISEPNERQTAVPLYQRAAGFGLPGVRVDGNDVLAVEAVVGAALDRARAGEGPTLVEAFTYRMAAHTTSDDTTRYRTRSEEAYWTERDPLARLEAHLRATGGADDAFFDALTGDADALGARVRRGVRALVDPEPTSMFDHVYADPHPLVEEERAWLADWVAAGEQGGQR